MDEWLEQRDTVDPEVRAYVGSLVTAVSPRTVTQLHATHITRSEEPA